MKKLLSYSLSVLLLCTAAFTAGGCAATGTRQSTGEYIDDTTITAKVKSALIADDTVKARDVQVETFRGSVQLSGFVDNDEQKSRAEQIARGVSGVRDVVNNVNLKTSTNDNTARDINNP